MKKFLMIVPKVLLDFYKTIKYAVGHFIEDNAIQLSASLSFYTLFAAAPIIIIIISLAGIFLGTAAVQGKIYGQINGLIGSGAALQIQDIIKNIENTHQGPLGAVVGVVILLIAATGVFTEIQDSVNYIWSIKAKPKKGWLKIIQNRLLSFSLIISLGFIMLISLVVSAVLDLLGERLMNHFQQSNIQIVHMINSTFIFGVITCLFAAIFKVLPDATITGETLSSGLASLLSSFSLANMPLASTWLTLRSPLRMVLRPAW